MAIVCCHSAAVQLTFTLNGNEVNGVVYQVNNKLQLYYLDFANIEQGPKVLGTMTEYTGTSNQQIPVLSYKYC